MKANDIILTSLAETAGYVESAITGLTPKELAWSPEPHSNTILFLMWHLARVEDLWINRILKGGKEIYETEGWYNKFKTPVRDNGYGYDMASLKTWPIPDLILLKAYSAAVRKLTVAYISFLKEEQFDEPRDFGWRKGTIGSALSHLISEVGEHSGQIGYIKGIMKGIENPPPSPKN